MKYGKTVAVAATRDALDKFTRRELRDYATSLGVKRGRSKTDMIRNLLDSGKATMYVTLRRVASELPEV